MKIIHGIVVFLTLVTAALAQPTAARFKYWRSIERAAGKEDEIVAIRLNSDIYAATRPGYPDIRVLDEADAEVPYVIERDVEVRQEKVTLPFPTEVVALKPNGNSIEVHIRLDEKAHDAKYFWIDTPLINYERKVRVDGSEDGKKWTPLSKDLIIFDYTQFMDVSSRTINLPENNNREFKVTIEDVTEEKESPFKELTQTFKDAKETQRIERTVIERRPFRIDRITAWGMGKTSESVTTIHTSNYKIVAFEAKEDAAKKQTIIDVRTRREPITHFVLETPNRNFSRRVAVEVPLPAHAEQDKKNKHKKTDHSPGWREIGGATIQKFNIRGQKHEQLTISVAQRHEEQFRIVVQNDDNPPLQISDVKTWGDGQRLIFLAQPAKTYRVLYGSESVPAPKYEAATVLATLRKDNAPVLAGLGKQKDNTEFGGEPASKARSIFNNWIFLGGAIGLMVIVLAWTLFRAGKRLENLPKE